jgi:pectinesterase
MKTAFFFILTFCLTGILSAYEAYDFVVAKDGSGNFRTLQEAINAVPDYRKKATTIFIKKGIYKEKVIVAESKKMVTLIGEDADCTIITYDDYAQKKNIFGEEKGTSGSAGVYVYGSDFSARNLTFTNTAGPVGQAVAVLVKADRAAFYNCRFRGFQDTLYAYGDSNGLARQYYENCYIEGTVDFIFGWATAWFERCTICSKLKNGYVTAAATMPECAYGFVFRECRLVAEDSTASVYLGRPWKGHAAVIYLACQMGNHIRPEGWHNWNNPDAEKASRYAEYKSSGPGGNSSRRVSWSRQLTDTEASAITPAAVLSGADGWMPMSKN